MRKKHFRTETDKIKMATALSSSWNRNWIFPTIVLKYFGMGAIETTLSLARPLMISEGCRFSSCCHCFRRILILFYY